MLGRTATGGVTSAVSTRERVLTAAGALTAARGSAAFSVADLSARSGVSNGSIYHHFGSKDGVLAALLVLAIDGYQQQVLRALHEHPDDAAGGVHAVVRGHLEWMAQHRCEARLLLEHRDALAGRPDIRKLNDRFRRRTTAWLRAQAAAGSLPAVTIETAHAVVFAPAQEISRLWVTGRLPREPPAYAAALGSAAFAALTALPDQ